MRAGQKIRLQCQLLETIYWTQSTSFMNALNSRVVASLQVTCLVARFIVTKVEDSINDWHVVLDAEAFT